MEHLEWGVMKYMRTPTAECIHDLTLKGDNKMADVLNESMYQYELTKRFVVKRPKYFIDKRIYIHTTLLPSLKMFFFETACYSMNKCFTKHFENIVEYESWWQCDKCGEDKVFECGCENTTYTPRITEGFDYDIFTHNHNPDQVKINWGWYNQMFELEDYDNIADEISYNYERWKNIAFESPCEMFGFFLRKSHSRFQYLFPRYYFS